MNPNELDRWASAMHAIRPDWRNDSLRTFAGKHLNAKPYRDALIAGAWVATDPTTQTPKLLTLDGPWWTAAAGGAARPQEPGIVTWCEHGRPGRCPDCREPVIRTAPTAEQREAMREAIASAREEIARLERLHAEGA